MTLPRSSATALAKELVASESRDSNGAYAEGAVLTKLYASLGKLIGDHGFDILLARAVKLAQRNEPSLAGLSLEPGGVLKGLPTAPGEQERALIAVVSQLIELLMRFIGEDLATRVVRDVWLTQRSAVD